MRHAIAKKSPSAFSLVEVLVAVAILLLMLLLVSQITQMTLQTSRATTAKMEGTEAARKLFDSLDRDLELSVAAPRLEKASTNLSILARLSASGSPELSFLTSGRGPSGTMPPRFLVVGYSMTKDTVTRIYSPVDWSATDLPQAAAAPAASGSGSSVVANGILQFSIAILLEDGSIASLADLGGPSLPNPLPAWGSRVDVAGSGTWTLLHPSRPPAPVPLNPTTARTSSLLVSVATIDERSYRLIPPAAFPLFPQPLTSDPTKEWESKLATLTLPGPVRASIRFHSMRIPLP